MPVTVDVRTEGIDPRLLDHVFADLRRVDAKFSPFIPTSAVCRRNRGELADGGVDPELGQVIHLCRLYEAATQGVFSAWDGDHFDPSGLVKGWAIDRCCSILEAGGARSYFVDAGGDAVARGGRGDGEPWRIGIRNPVERDQVVRVVTGQDLAVATSGTYEKGEHIWNRAPGSDLLSFTVVGRDIVEADVFATACFAMGLDGLEILEQRPGLEGYAIDAALVGRWTSGFLAARVEVDSSRGGSGHD